MKISGMDKYRGNILNNVMRINHQEETRVLIRKMERYAKYKPWLRTIMLNPNHSLFGNKTFQ